MLIYKIPLTQICVRGIFLIDAMRVEERRAFVQ